MKRRLARTAITALLCLNSSGCATSMTSELLLQQIKAKPAPVIVDVRSRQEYDADHIPGAVHIPFYAIDSGLQQLGASKKDTVVLYCEHGPRAGFAGLVLFFSGYESYYSVAGHMKAWRAGGLPVEKVPR